MGTRIAEGAPGPVPGGAVNADLKEEWEKYHQETERHVQVLQDVLSQLQLDAHVQTAIGAARAQAERTKMR